MADRDTRKTTPNDGDVEAFLDSVTDPRRKADAEAALDVMQRVTGAEPTMWGSSIIGFGRQPYTTADGKQHEWFAVGLSPRKASLTLYGLTYYDTNQDLLERLGPHTTGKGCVYVKRFDDLDDDVFEQLVRRCYEENNAAD